jgi:BirA family biotin operon repressor/biotin-[acetyl-CoA-carboxylase] ligase
MEPTNSRIIHIAETNSTNSDAMRLALKDEPLPLWVMADRQTAGRGRSGRSWISPPGNLYASLAFCCAAPLEKASQLSLIAGIALIDAIRSNTQLAPDTRLRLKWPNDVLIGSAKTGGILVDSTTARGSPGFLAILGFGVNIATSPNDLGRAATALGRHGKPAAPLVLLKALDEQILSWFGRWDAGANFSAVRHAWLERAGFVGEAITINTIHGPISGTYQGLSETGALRAEVDGSIREFNHGDVTLGGVDAHDGAA